MNLLSPSYGDGDALEALRRVSWSYLLPGESPAGTVPTSVPGAFVRTGATIVPPRDLLIRALTESVEEGDGSSDAWVFDGDVIVRNDVWWYSFGTYSSMPFGGFLAYAGGEVCVMETYEEIVDL